MIKKLGLPALVAVSMVLSACGGGGSSDPGTSSSTTSKSVAGPLDTVQATLSNSVLGPLESATANTALSGVLKCADGLVVGNVLDILDSVLNGLKDPTALASTTPAEITAQLNQLAGNLQNLLGALASKGSCMTAAATSGNPLAGTPLAPLGDQLLPVIQQIMAQTAPGSSNGYASLAALVTSLDTALHTALSKLPASATSAPIVGGTLTTLDTALGNTASVLSAVASNNSAGVKSSVQALINNLLVNVTTNIVPLNLLEAQGGQLGTVSTTIKQEAATLSQAVSTALGGTTAQLVAALSGTQLAPVVSPIINGVLPALIDPLTKLLDGLAKTGGSTTGGPTGTALDALLTPISTLLGTLLGGSGTSCIFASIPVVAGLCKK